MPKETGNPLNLERLSGRLHFQPSGEFGYLDLGDVTMFKFVPDTETVKAVFHTRSATEREARNDPKSSTLRWEVECQEHTLDIQAILLNGVAGADAVQAAAATQSVTLTSVKKGRVYSLGKMMIKRTPAPTVTGKIVGEEIDGEVVPANADIVIDYALGRVKVRESGTIAEGGNVTVGFDADAITMNTIANVGDVVRRDGAFFLDAFDGRSNPARYTIAFDGQLAPKERGQHDTGDFNKFSFEVTAVGDVAVKMAT